MKLQHPTLKNVQQEVPDKDVAQWVDAGWLNPTKPSAKPDAKVAASK